MNGGFLIIVYGVVTVLIRRIPHIDTFLPRDIVQRFYVSAYVLVIHMSKEKLVA